MDYRDENIEKEKGEMTVEEAGHKGGLAGGKKGGQRVKELIELGKKAQADEGKK